MTNESSSQSTPPGKKADVARGRSYARLAAVQALYEIEVAGAGAETVLGDFLSDRWAGTLDGGTSEENTLAPPVKTDRELLSALIQGVSERQGELDALIEPALSGKWSLARIEVLLKAIFRAGTYELLVRHDIPSVIVISEYVDVAHAFFSGTEPKLVNGVLDKLARTLRPDDFKVEKGER
jgi:N utilization substance protein B